MKKFILSSAVIISFILYGIHQQHEDSAIQIIAPKDLTALASSPEPSATTLSPSPTPTPTETPTTTSQPTQSQQATTTPKPTATPTPTSTPTPTPATGKYKNGTYTGSVADAYYGNVQVQAVIQGGKIVSVNFLQYPNDRATSIRINSQAMPYLQQEAIQVQSAQVDGVSGASDTSQAFRESLSAALSQAS